MFFEFSWPLSQLDSLPTTWLLNIGVLQVSILDLLSSANILSLFSLIFCHIILEKTIQKDQIKANSIAMSVESKMNENFKIAPGSHASENVDKTGI